MEDVFTVHSKSVGVDEKNAFLELNNIIESPFVTTINISRVAHTKWQELSFNSGTSSTTKSLPLTCLLYFPSLTVINEKFQ